MKRQSYILCLLTYVTYVKFVHLCGHLRAAGAIFVWNSLVARLSKHRIPSWQPRGGVTTKTRNSYLLRLA